MTGIKYGFNLSLAEKFADQMRMAIIMIMMGIMTIMMMKKMMVVTSGSGSGMFKSVGYDVDIRQRKDQ